MEGKRGLWLFQYRGEIWYMVLLKVLIICMVAVLIRFAFGLAVSADSPGPDVDAIQEKIAENQANLEFIQNELSQVQADDIKASPLATSLRNFDSYGEMQTWFEEALTRVDRSQSINEQIQAIQLLAIHDGYLFSIYPTTKQEYYDTTEALHITRLGGAAIADGSIYIIYLSDYFDYPIYWTVGQVSN